MTNFVLRVAAVAAVATAVSASALGQGQAPHAPPPPVQAGSAFVAGQVLDADTGRGVAGALVALVPTRALQAQVTVRALGVAADSQGRFYFAGLAAGEYLTQSETAGYLSVNSTVTFTLADGERKTDLRLTLRSVCFLYDDETYGFTPAEFLKHYPCEWEMVTLRRPVREKIRALAEVDKYDVYLNLCDGASGEDYPGLDVVEAMEEFNMPFTGASSNCYDPTREEMQTVADANGIGFAKGYRVATLTKMWLQKQKACVIR